MIFIVTVIDEQGKKEVIELDAENERAAILQIKSSGRHVYAIKPKKVEIVLARIAPPTHQELVAHYSEGIFILPMNQPLACPKCQSDDVKSFHVIYSHGHSVSNVSLRGVTVDNHTTAANRCAPPSRPIPPDTSIVVVVVIVSLFLVGVGIVVFPSSVGVGICFILLAAAISGYIIKAYSNSNADYVDSIPRYRAMMEVWQHMYQCSRCACEFIWEK